MTKRASAVLSAGVLILAGVLAGCSDDGDGGDFAKQGYDDIKKDAIKAMGDLKAVHVDAALTSEGTEITLNMSMSESGDCTGELSFGGAGAEILQTADGAWFKPNADLLQQQFGDQAADVSEFIGDKWVADTDGAVVAGNCDLEDFLENVTSDEEKDSNTDVGDTEELDGEEVVKITFTNDEGDGTAYIRTSEPHYIAKFEIEEGESPGSVTFSKFDEDVDAETPSDDDVVDLNDFAG